MPKRRQEPDHPEALTPVRIEVVPRRGVSRIEAARYVGISTTKFDELVREGQMPQPFRIGSRTIWDLRKLDAAFDELSGPDEGDSFTGRDTDTLTDEETLAKVRSQTDIVAARKAARREAHPPLMSKEHPGYHHVYTPESLAERWRCDAQTIRNMIRRGELVAFKYGGKLTRIATAAVIAYEKANTVEARR